MRILVCFDPVAKRLRWLGSTLEDLREQPEDVREFMAALSERPKRAANLTTLGR